MFLTLASLVFKKLVNRQVWLQFAELWLIMATKEESLLIIEGTLFKLANTEPKIHLDKQSETSRFFL